VTLFSDPISWARSAVGTRGRFALSILSFAVLQLALVHMAVTRGWQPAWSLAAFLVFFQSMFLYVLRRLLVGDAADLSSKEIA